MPGYAVIIPSRTDSNIIPCLTQLRKHEPSCPIVVVDDGLSVQAIDQARFCEPIHIAHGFKPFVFAKNVNGGIRTADIAFGDHRWFPGRPALDGYCILNDDALLESPDGFRLLADCCAADPSIGCIGATTNLTGQPLQQRRDVGIRDVEHIAFVCVYVPQTTIELLRMEGVINPNPAAQIDHSRDAWRSMISGGLLDERYGGYGSDDLDYCMQIRHVGLRVCVHDGCFVDHSKLHSSFRGAPETPGDIWPNHRLLRAKWGMPPNPMDPQQGGAR